MDGCFFIYLFFLNMKIEITNGHIAFPSFVTKKKAFEATNKIESLESSEAITDALLSTLGSFVINEKPVDSDEKVQSILDELPIATYKKAANFAMDLISGGESEKK